MNIFNQDDLVFLLKQDQSQVDMIVAGMTAILFDPENKCDTLKTQSWVKRMFASVIGVKSVNSEIIHANADALCAYCAEALVALYAHQRVPDSMVCNLEEQVKSLYALHDELKYITGAFAKNLGEKTKVIDRYFTLYKEIELGAFGSGDSAFWIYRMMAELDGRILQDKQKMELLTNLVFEKKIISKELMSVKEFVQQILDMPDWHVGAVYMELLNYSGNTTAELAMMAIELWHMQPLPNKQYLSTENIAAKIIQEFGVAPDIAISPEIEFEAMIETKMIHVAAALEAAMLKNVEELEREQMLRERQLELHANTQRNMLELKTNAQELQVNVQHNMQKGMRSIRGFFGRARERIANFARRRREA